MAPNAIKVYLVDDDEAVLSALHLLLETVGMCQYVFGPRRVFAEYPVPGARLHHTGYSHAADLGPQTSAEVDRVRLRLASDSDQRSR